MDEDRLINVIEKIDDKLFLELAERDFAASSNSDALQHRRILERIKSNPRFVKRRSYYWKIAFIPLTIAAAALLILIANPVPTVSYKGNKDYKGSLSIVRSEKQITFNLTGDAGRYYGIIGYRAMNSIVIGQGIIGDLGKATYEWPISLGFDKMCVVFSNTSKGLKFVLENSARLKTSFGHDRCINI